MVEIKPLDEISRMIKQHPGLQKEDFEIFRLLVDGRYDTTTRVLLVQEKMQGLQNQKDQAYWERNQLVAALSKLMPSCLGRHSEDDKEWENDWRNIVFIDSPQGQLSWHVHDNELPFFQHLKLNPSIVWDGHTTEEKYKRLENLTTDNKGLSERKETNRNEK